MDAKRWLALAAGKAAISISRRLGRGGSAFPGELARRLDPDVLAKLARDLPQGTILITGTNGKTTTARMVAKMLELAGFRVAHNRSGANMISGITTALVQAASLWSLNGDGRAADHDIGLAEVDEATVPRAARELRPRLILVTNFFRDQLDRYGELRHVAALVAAGIGALGAVPTQGGAGYAPAAILNADDPLVAGLAGAGGAGTGVFFYGIADRALGNAAGIQAADARHCVLCGESYIYDTVFYAHLGHYRCPSCGHRRPDPQVALVKAESRGLAGWFLCVATPAGEVEALLPAPGLHNVYNALAAVAAASTLGIPLAAIRQGLEGYAAAFGRMEVIPIRGRQVCVALVKNPVAFNQMLRTVMNEPLRQRPAAIGQAAVPGAGADDAPRDVHAADEQAPVGAGPTGRCLLTVINDRAADGKDVSWLWDVDFEQLVPRAGEFAFIHAAGIRAEEMALRLKYAGFPAGRLAVRKDIGEALAAAIAATPPGRMLWVLPTYTALLEVREVIHRWGFAPHFWEV